MTTWTPYFSQGVAGGPDEPGPDGQGPARMAVVEQGDRVVVDEELLQ